MKPFTLPLLLLAVTTTTATMADDFDDLFSDDPFANVDISADLAEPSVFSLAHELGVTTMVNVNSNQANAVEKRFHGLSSAQVFYKPSFSYSPNDTFSVNGEFLLATDTIFWLRPDDDWSAADKDARQYQGEVQALTAQARLNQWQLSTGIQTVTLGLADALSVVNVLHGQNLAVPGAKGLDDTVIPAWVTMASGAMGPVRLKTGVIHRHQINTLPAAGTDFDTGMTALLEINGLSYQAEPFALENAGAFASFSGVVGPLDWQLNAISQLEHSPTLALQMTGQGPMPAALYFPRTNTVGVAGSYVMGSLLWKAEAAWLSGLQAQALNGAMPGDLVDYQRLAGTVGVDINHSTLGRLVAEVQATQIVDYDALNLMSTDEYTAQWMVMASKTFMRDTLTLSAQVMAFDLDASGGRIQGLNAEYDVNDQTSLALRYLDYVAGDFSLLNGADDRDRLIASMHYRF